MTETILITGFLGAGKSAVRGHLANRTDATIIEVPGLQTPTPTDPAPRAIIGVADAANLVQGLADPVLGPLLTAQIQAADLIVLTRSDLTAPGPAQKALAELTDQPIIDAPFGDTDLALPPHRGTPITPVDLSDQFVTWSYQGPATLTHIQAELLLEHRPKGITRISGTVRTDQGGLDLQLAGQVRQTIPIDDPGETTLTAIGRKGTFRKMEMDLTFGERTAASAHLTGLFSHR